MKQKLDQWRPKAAILAMLVLGLVLVACDNQFNVGPTEPEFPRFGPNQGLIKTLEITGDLLSDQGSCVKATILFDGQEINGARARCRDEGGCAEMALAGQVDAAAGHHTITFQVLRQSAQVDEYLAMGAVEVTLPGLDLEPYPLELRPTRALLHEGEGVSFDIHLYD